MKTTKQFLMVVMLLGLATTVMAQNGKISPVYIPGANLDTQNIVKTSTSNNPVSTSKSSSYFGTTGSSTNPKTTSSSSITGCDCGGSGCDSGGCGCGQGGFDSVGKNYLDCGCDSGNCGCGGRGRLGGGLFGAVRNLIPVKLSFNQQGDCGCDECTPGNCQTFGGGLLPFKARLCSNHCCRYVSVFGGYVDLEDYDGMAAASRLIEFNGGWQFGIKRGRIFNNGVRLESEFSFRHNTNDVYSLGNFVGPDFVAMSTVDATGSVYHVSNMTNVLKDLDSLATNGVTPYVGFGLGGVYADGEIETALPTFDFISDYAFAYQLIVGLNRRVSNNVSAFAEYKYFGSSGVEVQDGTGAVVGEFDLQSNNLLFGLQFIRPR